MERKWNRVLSDIYTFCTAEVSEESVCIEGLATAQGRRDRELTRLELRRRHARVETSAAQRLESTELIQ